MIKEMKQIKATIYNISETTYEDNTYWVEYKIGDLIGYEIVDGDSVEKYRKEGVIYVDEKPQLNICSEYLATLINECRCSSNEMWFVEEDEITDNDLIAVEEEVERLNDKYNNLEISDYVIFREDCPITIYGGICTKFLF